jgi:hypothetical protein
MYEETRKVSNVRVAGAERFAVTSLDEAPKMKMVIPSNRTSRL